MDERVIIEKPLITEKATLQGEKSMYSFEVNKNANKAQIKNAVEKLYSVKVLKVRTLLMPGKVKRVGKTRRFTKLSDWKKSIITLKKGQTIDVLEVKK